MAYRFQHSESVLEGAQRIALEQIDKALARLTASGADLDADIHAARVAFKKLRALTRLVREAIGEARYRRENRSFRDAGRQLAAVRDTAVMIETLDHLLAGSAHHFTVKTRSALRRAFMKAEAQPDDRKPAAMFAVAEMVAAARMNVEGWPTSGAGFRAVQRGLRRTCRGCRARMVDALEHPTADRFHEWRKQVKYLWYQINLLEAVRPKRMRKLAEELETLADHLSIHHDMAVLRRRMPAASDPHIEEATLQQVLALIDARSAETEALALALGTQIFTDKPSAFAGRIRKYWRAWRA